MTDNGIGTDIDFSRELGISNKSFNEVRLTWGNMRLAYTNFDYSGHNKLARDIDFNGGHYTVNDMLPVKWTSSITG